MDLNISSIDKLSVFIESYPIRELRPQFQLLQSDFPMHRKVRGDGNCFYRAFAFQYLAKANIHSGSLPQCQNICSNGRYLTEQFKVKLRKHLKWLQGVNGKYKQQTIEEKFNNQDQFDQIMIAYFRSSNYNYILKKKHHYFPYVDEDQVNAELTRIATMDAESEGIELPALADLFNVKLYIFFIDEKSFQPVVFNQVNGSVRMYLFYRPGHYDIVYPDQDKKIERFMPKSRIFVKPTPIQGIKNLFHNISRPQPSTLSSKPIFLTQKKPEPSSHAKKQVTSTKSNLTCSSKNSKDEASSSKSLDQINRYQRKPNKVRVIQSSQSLTQFNKFFIQLTGVGLIIAVCYFIYVVS